MVAKKSTATKSSAAKSSAAKPAAQYPHGTQHNNPDPQVSHSGLDVQGQFRIGEKISLAVRGAGLVLMQSGSGREVEVSEATLSGLLENEYFVDKIK